MMANEPQLTPIPIPAHPGDDPRFLELIQMVIAAELTAQGVREIFLVRIDNWFDDQWLGVAARFFFGGVTVVPDKASGDFRKLAFPPFAPGRVVAEHHFVKGDNSHYGLAEEARLVHSLERSRSAKNYDRSIVAFSPSALFVWFGSNSHANGRGSLMIYRSAPEGLNAWYSSFDGSRDWQPSRTKGIARTQLEAWMRDLNSVPALDDQMPTMKATIT